MQTQTNGIKIKSSKITVNLFPENKPKNRRMTPWEKQEEKEIAAIFKRPPRDFIFDFPTYPFFPITPKVPKINFDLNYSE